MTKREKKLVENFISDHQLVMYDLRLGRKRFFQRPSVSFRSAGVGCWNYVTSSCDFIPLDSNGNGLLFLVG